MIGESSSCTITHDFYTEPVRNGFAPSRVDTSYIHPVRGQGLRTADPEYCFYLWIPSGGTGFKPQDARINDMGVPEGQPAALNCSLFSLSQSFMTSYSRPAVQFANEFGVTEHEVSTIPTLVQAG